MSKLSLRSVLPWLLAAFFVFGGLGNIFATETIKTDYRGWGYPDWFHYVTGILELAAAGMIAIRRTRFFGAALGCCIMAGAIVTVLVNREYTHAIAPMVVFSVSLIVALFSRPRG